MQTRLTQRHAIIQTANNQEMKQKAFSLRYQVLCEEKQWSIPQVDHNSKSVTDELDAVSEIFLVEDYKSETVGSVRSTFFNNQSESLQKHLQLKGARLPENLPLELCSYSSRFVISHHNRIPSLGREIFIESYKLWQQNNANVNFIISRTELLPYYFRLGYQLLHENLGASESHSMNHLLYLLVHDRSYLQLVQSPAATLCHPNYQQELQNRELRKILHRDRFVELAS